MDIQTVKQMAAPIFRQYQVRKAAVFGSLARGESNDTSDVDILLELPDHASLFDVVALSNDLKDALHTPVDLVEYDAVKPALRQFIIGSEIPIYPI